MSGRSLRAPRLRDRPGTRQGSVVVETAMILPVMLTLMVGIFEIAWYYHHQYAVSTAATIAARAAAAEGDANAIATTASTEALDVLNRYGIGSATVTASLEAGPPEFVTVQVNLPFSSIAGLVPMPLSIVSVATAIYEDVDN